MTELTAATAFTDLISSAMTEKNISIRGLAEKLEVTYEHARRIVRGDIPSLVLLKAVCKELDIDYTHAKKLARTAKAMAEYGDVILEVSGKNPEIYSIEQAWPKLTREQKTHVLSAVSAFAQQNTKVL